MSITRLQNVETSEYRDTIHGDAEYKALMAEVGQGGLPKWRAVEMPREPDPNEPEIEDLSESTKNLLPAAVVLHLEGIPPERNPHLQLTGAELDVGLTSKSKIEELLEQFKHLIPGYSGGASVDDQAARQAAEVLAAGGGAGHEGGSGQPSDEPNEAEGDDEPEGSDEGSESEESQEGGDSE